MSTVSYFVNTFNYSTNGNIVIKEVSSIPLDKIKVGKHNVRIHDIDDGIEDLAANIKAVGLLQPITAYLNSDTGNYIILAGQRRLNAFYHLNESHTNEGYDHIPCIVIDEPKSDEEKLSLSLAENITQLQMHNSDLVKAVTDLYNVYGDYDVVKEKFGLTKYMIDKYVRLARLPEDLKVAINEGAISPNNKTAENAAIRAVDALNWIKGGDISEQKVLDLAKEYAKEEISKTALDDAARKGGSIEDIKNAAKKKNLINQPIELSTEIAEKLKHVAESNGESVKSRATNYVVKGVHKDYADLES